MDDDVSLIIRRCKRGNLTKLDLSRKDMAILPYDIYQLPNLEILDLQNNKITTLDSKISLLTKLKFLDLSSNQLNNLPNSLLKMTNLQVLNLSNNPLYTQFEPLLKKENQSEPKLMITLKSCFANQTNLSNNINNKNDGFYTTNMNFGTKIEKANSLQMAKPNWLEVQKKEEIPLGLPNPKETSITFLKNQLMETETALANEQKKVLELNTKLEHMMQQETLQDQHFHQIEKNVFGLDANTAKALEISPKEFETFESISQGGFSIVHKGVFRGTKVAIKKIFNPNITQELMDDLSNEIQMLNILRHPNVVLLMGICSKPQNLCIITEYLPNGSLYNMLHLSKIEIKNSLKLEIAKEIAIVLNYIHLSKVVHRDIKSHNVLLDDKFRIKLCDFGLSRHMSTLNTGLMQYCGTPSYMAPELFMKKSYDKKIDVFAYGTLLWELYSRKVPFEGMDPVDIMDMVVKEESLPLINIPKKIGQLINDCRATNPNKRPSFDYIVEYLYSVDSSYDQQISFFF